MNFAPHSPIWHPFTQHALRPSLPRVLRAEGAYLFTESGQRILDAISSWWVITHGHCHPRIVDAIKRQAEVLDQVIFAEYTHDSAERVAARLIALAPKDLKYVFFSDSGSTSVEVALKMALGFWRHTGERRDRIIVLEHGYHGDTIGTMSVGARGAFTDPYDALLFNVERIPFPSVGREDSTLAALETLCRRGDAAAAQGAIVVDESGRLGVPVHPLGVLGVHGVGRDVRGIMQYRSGCFARACSRCSPPLTRRVAGFICGSSRIFFCRASHLTSRTL